MSEKSDPKNFVRLGDVLKIAHELRLKDPSALNLYQRWLKGVQERVEKTDTPIARIKLEITCAEVYLEIDMPIEAAECFRDALTEAQQGGLINIVLDLERALETVAI
jgi:hypothetical protein